MLFNSNLEYEILVDLDPLQQISFLKDSKISLVAVPEPFSIHINYSNQVTMFPYEAYLISRGQTETK